MRADLQPSNNLSDQPASVPIPAQGVPAPLRIWLILLTIAASLTCLLTGGLALITSAVLLYLFEDPNYTFNQALFTEIGLWLVTLILAALLLVGVIGGWRAFRRSSYQLAVVVSLLALPPIGLCLAGIVIAVLTSSSPFPISVDYNP